MLPSIALLVLASIASSTIATPLPLPAFADLDPQQETQKRASWSNIDDSHSPLLDKRDEPDWDLTNVHPVSLIDYNPKLTYPTQGVVWQAGGQGYITWNGELPSGISQGDVSQTADLVLGYTSDESIGLHLDLDNPLGTDIPLYTAPYKFTFTLPSDLPTRTTYILSFIGSSGNISPTFTIEALSGVQAPASSPSTSASSTSSESDPDPTTSSSSTDDSNNNFVPTATAVAAVATTQSQALTTTSTSTRTSIAFTSPSSSSSSSSSHSSSTPVVAAAASGTTSSVGAATTTKASGANSAFFQGSALALLACFASTLVLV
ncbi:hypothetical protein T439DRAFT_320805 [Meredithblackwellia eburnea MCA 4105]